MTKGGRSGYQVVSKAYQEYSMNCPSNPLFEYTVYPAVTTCNLHVGNNNGIPKRYRHLTYIVQAPAPHYEITTLLLTQ